MSPLPHRITEAHGLAARQAQHGMIVDLAEHDSRLHIYVLGDGPEWLSACIAAACAGGPVLQSVLGMVYDALDAIDYAAQSDCPVESARRELAYESGPPEWPTLARWVSENPEHLDYCNRYLRKSVRETLESGYANHLSHVFDVVLAAVAEAAEEA